MIPEGIIESNMFHTHGWFLSAGQAWSVGWLAGWLVGWVGVWLDGWLDGWLVGLRGLSFVELLENVGKPHHNYEASDFFTLRTTWNVTALYANIGVKLPVCGEWPRQSSSAR